MVSQSTFAAAVAYWSYSGWDSNHGATYIYSTTSFTKASTADSTISISGWSEADSSSSHPTGVKIGIVKKNFFGSDTVYGTQWTIDSIYYEGGSWYSNVFSSIPKETALHVRVYNSNYHTNPISGAGNAYD